MRTDFYGLDTPSAPGTGAQLPVEEYTDKSVQLSGTFSVASVTIEGTLDGTNFGDVTGSLTAVGDIGAISSALKAIRVRVDALTGGTAAVKFVGRLAR